MKSARPLLIFDVNETLLDLEPMRRTINEALSSRVAFETWFSKLLQFSLMETLTGHYRDFGDIGISALQTIAQKHTATLSEDKIRHILERMTNLETHPDVPGALKKLKEAGFRMVTLSNGGQATVEKQLENAQLTPYFDAVYSVASVKKFKPHPDTYNFVLQQQKRQAADAVLIAAHDWDIYGAQRAGLQAAFISRPGNYLYPGVKEPRFVAKALEELARLLVRMEM